jgi:hypothetical protein
MTKGASPVRRFCNDHGISVSHLYNLLKSGKGPAIMKVGKRTLISDEAAAAWRRRMEGLDEPHGSLGSANAGKQDVEHVEPRLD